MNILNKFELEMVRNEMKHAKKSIHNMFILMAAYFSFIFFELFSLHSHIVNPTLGGISLGVVGCSMIFMTATLITTIYDYKYSKERENFLMEMNIREEKGEFKVPNFLYPPESMPLKSALQEVGTSP